MPEQVGLDKEPNEHLPDLLNVAESCGYALEELLHDYDTLDQIDNRKVEARGKAEWVFANDQDQDDDRTTRKRIIRNLKMLNESLPPLHAWGVRLNLIVRRSLVLPSEQDLLEDEFLCRDLRDDLRTITQGINSRLAKATVNDSQATFAPLSNKQREPSSHTFQVSLAHAAKWFGHVGKKPADQMRRLIKAGVYAARQVGKKSWVFDQEEVIRSRSENASDPKAGLREAKGS